MKSRRCIEFQVSQAGLIGWMAADVRMGAGTVTLMLRSFLACFVMGDSAGLVTIDGARASKLCLMSASNLGLVWYLTG